MAISGKCMARIAALAVIAVVCGCVSTGDAHRIGHISDKEVKGLVFFDTETTGTETANVVEAAASSRSRCTARKAGSAHCAP